MVIEKIYKCRFCGNKFSIVDEGKGNISTPKEIVSDKCTTCCSPVQTNGAKVFVIADLTKYIKIK